MKGVRTMTVEVKNESGKPGHPSETEPALSKTLEELLARLSPERQLTLLALGKAVAENRLLTEAIQNGTAKPN